VIVHQRRRLESLILEQRERRFRLPHRAARLRGAQEPRNLRREKKARLVEVARGLSNYSSDEITQIAGQRSDKIAELLGHCPYQEVVHRDNMVVTRANGN